MAVTSFDDAVKAAVQKAAQQLGLSAQQAQLFEKSIIEEPKLNEGWLRQDDYSKKHEEMKAQLDKAQDDAQYREKMVPWAEDAYGKLHRLEEAGVLDKETGNELWTEQKTKLEQELEAAKKAAVAGGEMTPEQLDAEVRKIIKDVGTSLTKEEIAALYADQAKKLVDEGFKEREAKFNSETIPFVAGFSAAMAVVAGEYVRETGEPWTEEKQQEAFKMLTPENKFNPFAIKDKLLEPAKQKKADEEKFQARLKEELAKRGVPGGGEERYIPQPGEARGALQAALEASNGGGDIESLIKSKAVEGAKELVADGKF